MAKIGSFFSIDPDDHLSFEDLVAMWVADPTTRPKTYDEFKAALRAKGVRFDEPDGKKTSEIKDLQFVDSPEHVLLISLPTDNQLSVGKAEATADTTRYPLPAEYDKAYVGEQRKNFIDATARLNILRSRVAAYCIGTCM